MKYKKLAFRHIFFELIFSDNDKSKIIPDDEIVKTEWQKIIDNSKRFNDPVDYIGNRYYYIKKNYVLILMKEQTSLKTKALGELMKFQLESQGIVLDPEYMMKKYNEHYNGKEYDDKELNNTLKHFNDFTKINCTIDIFTLG